MSVTRPLFLVESRSQDAAANAGVLSVYLTTILLHHPRLFFDMERENIHSSITVFHSLGYLLRLNCINCIYIQSKILFRSDDFAGSFGSARGDPEMPLGQRNLQRGRSSEIREQQMQNLQVYFTSR